MGETPAKPRRRWIRGGVFWLCVVLAGLIAGSWIRSYWRDEGLLYRHATGWRCVAHSTGVFAVWIVEGMPLNQTASYPYHRGAQWIYRGVPLRFSWLNLARFGWFTDHDSFYGSGYADTHILFPYWAPLALCLGGASWASRPWRNRKRESRRGFDVVQPGEADHG